MLFISTHIKFHLKSNRSGFFLLKISTPILTIKITMYIHKHNSS
nr:MAG TPA: hypothetical protein [Caudoviricetes sp.]